MFVYILSNANQVLGVFSSPFEAQIFYSNIVKDDTFTIKLEEFTLNKTPGKNVTFLMEEIDSKKEEYSYSIFEKTPFKDIVYECYNCGGEDCRDGCVNDNLFDF